jgi:hypothetical protein
MILKKKFRLQFRGEKTKHFDIHYAHLAAKKKNSTLVFKKNVKISKLSITPNFQEERPKELSRKPKFSSKVIFTGRALRE